MTVQCSGCRAEKEVPITSDQMLKWIHGGYLQAVAPNLTAEEQDIMVTGLCSACYTKLANVMDYTGSREMTGDRPGPKPLTRPSPRMRRAFDLRVRGFSYKIIAAKMGISRSGAVQLVQGAERLGRGSVIKRRGHDERGPESISGQAVAASTQPGKEAGRETGGDAGEVGQYAA